MGLSPECCLLFEQSDSRFVVCFCFGQFQFTQFRESAGAGIALINRVGDIRVPKTLKWLPEPVNPPFTDPAHMFEVQFHDNDLATRGGLVDDGAIGPNDYRFAVSKWSRAIQTKDIQ